MNDIESLFKATLILASAMLSIVYSAPTHEETKADLEDSYVCETLKTLFLLHRFKEM